jgi:hypothetical protein
MFAKPIIMVMSIALVALPIASFGASWPDPPVPAQTQVSSVANRIVYNGLDMRANVFESQQSSADIQAFYRKLWGDRLVVNKMGDNQVIGHREGDYFVTVEVADAGGGSKGRIGVVDLASAPKHMQLGKGLATPDGTKVFNDIAYPDDPTPARTIAMGNGLSANQNAQFFRTHLLAEGWHPSDDNRCLGTGCVLSYERGSRKMTVVVAQGNGNRSQIVVTMQDPQGVTP